MSAPCSKGRHRYGVRQRVVDDERHAGAMGDLGDRLDVGDDAAGIGDRLDEDRLGARRDRRLEGGEVVGVGPGDLPAEILDRVAELVDGAAIEPLCRDDLVAGLHQRVEHDELRPMAGCDGERRGAALQRSDALLQHRLRRVPDARVDVAEGFQREQRGGVLDVVEDEGGGLVDRRGARAGRRVGLRPRMDRQCRKARSAFLGHEFPQDVAGEGLAQAGRRAQRRKSARLPGLRRNGWPEATRRGRGRGAGSRP